MNNVAIVFWSGTGNTESMANIIFNGVNSNGGEAKLFNASEFSANLVDDYSAIAFGCPAMGAEELEDSEFLPMFNDCESKLNGKKISLFGSYGWGDGEWIRTWTDTCISDGAIVTHDAVICCGEPTSDTEVELVDLAKSLLA
ncbi:MAG: flavodoxin [Ruminococcus sp.]|nr:flavodoxin [Ruminococcus sp.]MCD7800355.1 flavodoxin [Ruminococcus sp.]